MTRNYFDQVTTSPYDFQYQSAGVFRENQVLINSNVRLAKITVFGFYSANFANANTSGASFIPTSNTNTKVDYGRATFAQRQFGVVGGNIQMRYGFSASPFIIARAGAPYNITSGLDPTGSSIYNARPYFANGSSGNCFDGATFSPTQTGNLKRLCQSTTARAPRTLPSTCVSQRSSASVKRLEAMRVETTLVIVGALAAVPVADVVVLAAAVAVAAAWVVVRSAAVAVPDIAIRLRLVHRPPTCSTWLVIQRLQVR